jgi:DNA polymerase-3 subunit epsilon
MKPPVDLGCFPSGRHYPGIAHLLRVAAAGVADEFSAETEVAALPLVALDTETTGRDPPSDRVIEVAAILADGPQIVNRLSWLVNPGCPIPKQATEVHGISDADIKDAPSFSEILPALTDALSQRIPLAYNASFDRQFLMAEYERCAPMPGRAVPAFRRNVEWIDPLVWARELQRHERSRSLADVCGRLGIALDQAHRATDDAEAALKVLLALLPDSRIPRTYAAFLQEQRRLGSLHEQERARWRNRGNKPGSL